MKIHGLAPVKRRGHFLFAAMAALSVLTISILGLLPAGAASPPTIVNEQFTTSAGSFSPVTGGTWTVSGGTYMLTNPANADSGNGNIAVSDTPLTGAWTIEASAKPAASTGEYSVIFDYSDPQNYSYAHFHTTQSDFSQGIFKVQGGNVSRLASYNSPVPANAFQTVKVKYDSGKIKVYKGSTYLTGVDMTVRNGAVTGVGTTNTAASFDNYTISGTRASSRIAPLPQVEPKPPVTPPSAPTACANFQAIRTIPVATTAELQAALANAQPGDDISLANGTYTDGFTLSAQGTAQAPIRLRGSANTIIDGGGIADVYALHLNGATNWCIDGMSITNARKGIMTDSASNNVIQNIKVSAIGDEAVHFRSCSSNNILQNSEIYNTGLRRDSFGEGVYLGTADSNWGVYNYCDLGNPDQSNYNRVLNNSIHDTTAEAIDVKEGTQGGIISGNNFDGVGMNGNHADSLIDVKGANYDITHNTVAVSGPSAVVDGFSTQVISVRTEITHSGTGNVFSENTFNLNGATGYGIRVGNGATALVTCNNIVTGAALGLSNIACRP